MGSREKRLYRKIGGGTFNKWDGQGTVPIADGALGVDIIVGNKLTDQKIELLYDIYFPISGKIMSGNMTIINDKTLVEIPSNQFEFPDSQGEINTIVFSVLYNLNNIILNVQLTGVGEAGTFEYNYNKFTF